MTEPSKRAQRRDGIPAPVSGEDTTPEPVWFRPVATMMLGGAYIATAMALLVLSQRETGKIGAVCGDSCGGVTLLGVSLEWWGGALMAGVMGTRWWAYRSGLGLARHGVAALALGHAGASLAFAGSQWLGIASICPLCQLAALLSVAVAVTCWRVVLSASEAPLIPAAQSLALGIVGVMAVWPFLDGPHLQSRRDAAPEGVMAPAGAPAGIGEWMDALTIGNPSAPFEFAMITDFDCRICQRFEEEQLPRLIREGVETGLVRVRFLVTRRAGRAAAPFNELAAATALARAGVPLAEVMRLMRQEPVVSAPQAVARVADPAVRARAMEILKRVGEESGWNAVVDEHERRARALRAAYFPERGGTPAFVIVRGALDPASPPPPGDTGVLALYGFQLASSFLEFARAE